MKNIAGFVVLIALCIVLAITLLVRNKQAADQMKTDTDMILNLSNKWVKTSGDLDEQRQVNVSLTDTNAVLKNEIANLADKLAGVSATLNKTEASLEAAEKEVAKREAKIADLEAQNESLDKQAVELSLAITNLNAQIADTQRKLATAEGDKTFLESELRRLMAEKAELERKFNDLGVLRAQVKKLREELSIAKRLEWIRKGLFAETEEKGAQKLMEGAKPPSAEAGKGRYYDLNVEVGSDGSVRVIPSLTNRPAATNPPSK